MYRRNRYLAIIVAALLATLTVLGQQKTEAIHAANTPIPTQPVEGGSIPQYGLFETTLPITGSVSNAFDPNQIDVEVEFTAPNGGKITVPGFWMQPYQSGCTQNCSDDSIKPVGDAGWRVRFSPNIVGNWTYAVQEQDTISRRTISRGAVVVSPSKNAGFIHVGKNPHYFGFDSGAPYFPVGINLGWSWDGASGTTGYLSWLKKLHDAGANYARLYVDVPWFIGLDWRAPVGNYVSAQEDSWKLDSIVRSAEDQDIALEIVLVWYQGFTTFTGLPVNPPATPARPDTSADWSKNPYNGAIGGPLNSAAQFFESDQGRNLFKRRLRYVVARWGYSTSIFAWDMIDQLDHVPLSTPDSGADWLHETVNYLRTIDPYKHPITAGLRDSSKSALLDKAVLDFFQVRYYQRRPIEPAADQVTGALNALGSVLGSADRPVVLSEFSLNPWFEPTADDPTGVHVRETMWASALSGAGGSGTSWWWDTYLFPQDLTGMFAPLAAFTQGIPWNTSNLQPVGASVVGDQNVDYAGIKLSGYNGTYGGPKAPDVTFRVTPDGVVPPISSTSSYLYGV